MLARNENAKLIGNQIQITTRQPKNLQRIVRDSNFSKGKENTVDKIGCFKCGKCKVACPIINESEVFESTNTKKTYKIKKYLDCDSEYIIYLSTCKKCGGQYCGKSTRKFKQRHSGHKQEIKNSYGDLGHHFGGNNGCGYHNVNIQIIDQVQFGDMNELAERELYRQHQL